MSNEKLLKMLSKRPEPYEAGTLEFWDDDHISKGMLEAHLNPMLDSATREIEFVKASSAWIADISNVQKRPRLLDLGCGPGIYAELLAKKGFHVTGIDYSRRSIDYARKVASEKKLNIDYRWEDYQNINFNNEFDVIIMIYCDFGVLPQAVRELLLLKVYQALKPGGLFIFDAFTPLQFTGKQEFSTWSYADGGYWSEAPYACLYSFYRYDCCNTFADQYIIIEENNLRCFNLWNHAFSADELAADLSQAGFQKVSFRDDAAGGMKDSSPTICAVAER